MHVAYDQLRVELQNLSAVISVQLDAAELERNPDDTQLVEEVRSQVKKMLRTNNPGQNMKNETQEHRIDSDANDNLPESPQFEDGDDDLEIVSLGIQTYQKPEVCVNEIEFSFIGITWTHTAKMLLISLKSIFFCSKFLFRYHQLHNLL